MADCLANRMKELDEVYQAVSASSSCGSFGYFLRSKLTKDALKKCGTTSVDMRYVTIQPDTQLISFSEQWQHEIAAHVYSTRYDDPVSLPKTAESETSCVRLFATTKPVRVLAVQRNSVLELCKKWVREHYEGSNGAASNGEEGTPSTEDGDLLPAIPRNLFQRKDGISILDYALYSERSSNFHGIEGVAFDEPASSTSGSPSRHLLLFGTDVITVQQELVYPSKKKLRKGQDGFLSCISEPSRPQAPPMKRGKSVNTPPIHSPSSAPPPPPPYQPKTPPPQPTPRPSTPTLTDEKGEAKPPPKPQAPPRESIPIYSTPHKPQVDYSSDEAAKLELDNNTQM